MGVCKFRTIAVDEDRQYGVVKRRHRQFCYAGIGNLPEPAYYSADYFLVKIEQNPFILFPKEPAFLHYFLNLPVPFIVNGVQPYEIEQDLKVGYLCYAEKFQRPVNIT